MRINGATRGGLAATIFFAAAVAVWACADPGTRPTWELAKDYYDLGGSSAVLTPGNDTRVNLLLLLADRRGAAVRHPRAEQKGPPLVLFPWKLMSAAAAAPSPVEAPTYGLEEASRCQSQASGAAAFAAAVRASHDIPAEEKARLTSARTAFVPDCSGSGAAAASVTAASPAGRAFAAYLTGAGQFYGGRFAEARGTFAALGSAPDPWLRETALYMVARAELNRAQQGSFDEYGSLAEPARRDRAAIAAAGAGLEAYLKAYPNGRYASSARGLTRRVAWLSDQRDALAAAYDRQLAKAGAFDGAASESTLAEEIDNALLNAGNSAAASRDPLLVAVEDLQRMRCVGGNSATGEGCGTRLTRQELDRQAPLFAREPALLSYLRAAEAYFVRRQPRDVLSLIPDAARQTKFTYLEFSRQVMRGMALDAVRDRNARGFWLSLFPGAQQPYQREALELALALHEERSGGLAQIYAADSKVRHPVIRQLLLEHVAGPDLLRQQARAAGAPKQEREVAAFVLLSKDLLHGFYREFLEDVRLAPAGGVRETGYYQGALDYDPVYSEQLEPPPLDRFGAGAKLGDAGCPALIETVRQLAAAPGAIRPRLCLAEYVRSTGFDEFPLDVPVGGRGLAASAPQFPGKPFQRLEVYKAIIADPAAGADDRALALNRAVRCYAPSHANSCGGTDVPVEQRRAWFNRLKKDYPASRWAQSLKYYW